VHKTATNRHLNLHQNETIFDQKINGQDTLSSAFFQVTSGEHIGRIIPLNRSMIRLGLSGIACAVVVNRGEDGYFLSHLEGKEQPLVNRIPTGNSSIHLPAGALIEIEGVQMKFHQGNALAADNMV